MSEALDESEIAGGILVWVDTETTGLDCQCDDVLELGVKVTNKDLKVLREKSWVVVPPRGWYSKLEDKSCVMEMHENSGLLGEVLRRSEELEERNGAPMDETNTNLVSYAAWTWLVDDLGIKPGERPMVGSNVANFDRRFAQDKLLMFNAFFHYRNIDVSTIKELCKMYRPDIYARLPQPDAKAHRVLGDIDWSITELRFYLDNFINLDALETLGT